MEKLADLTSGICCNKRNLFPGKNKSFDPQITDYDSQFLGVRVNPALVDRGMKMKGRRGEGRRGVFSQRLRKLNKIGCARDAPTKANSGGNFVKSFW